MKKIFTLLVLMVFALAIAGCKKPTTVNNAQGVTDTEIKVGNCAATSGVFAGVGVPFNTGIEAYFKMINENGGINGRKIKFVHEDDEFNAEKAKACVEKMIDTEKIFAFVGHFGTTSVAATLIDIKEAGIPAVYFATGIGTLYNENATGEDRVIFPVQPIYQMEGRIMVARTIGEFNAAKIGVIYTNDDAGKDLLSGIYTQVGKARGVSVVAEQIPALSTDVSSAVTKLLSEDVDVIILAMIQGTFPTVVKELAKQGNTLPVLTSYVSADLKTVENIKTDVGDKFDVYANAWVDTSDAEALALFAQWVEAQKGDNTYNANSFAMAGWIAAHYFVEGLKNVEGDLTWDSYMNGLEKEPIKNPFGGYIDFSDGKRLGTQEMSLLIMNPTNPLGWDVLKPIQSIDEIIAE